CCDEGEPLNSCAEFLECIDVPPGGGFMPHSVEVTISGVANGDCSDCTGINGVYLFTGGPSGFFVGNTVSTCNLTQTLAIPGPSCNSLVSFILDRQNAGVLVGSVSPPFSISWGYFSDDGPVSGIC